MSDTPYIRIRKNLRRLLADQKMTAEKLAWESEISKSQVSRILSGKIKSPGLETLTKIADGLNIDIVELFKE